MAPVCLTGGEKTRLCQLLERASNCNFTTKQFDDIVTKYTLVFAPAFAAKRKRKFAEITKDDDEEPATTVAPAESPTDMWKAVLAFMTSLAKRVGHEQAQTLFGAVRHLVGASTEWATPIPPSNQLIAALVLYVKHRNIGLREVVDLCSVAPAIHGRLLGEACAGVVGLVPHSFNHFSPLVSYSSDNRLSLCIACPTLSDAKDVLGDLHDCLGRLTSMALESPVELREGAKDDDSLRTFFNGRATHMKVFRLRCRGIPSILRQHFFPNNTLGIVECRVDQLSLLSLPSVHTFIAVGPDLSDSEWAAYAGHTLQKVFEVFPGLERLVTELWFQDAKSRAHQRRLGDQLQLFQVKGALATRYFEKDAMERTLASIRASNVPIVSLCGQRAAYVDRLIDELVLDILQLTYFSWEVKIHLYLSATGDRRRLFTDADPEAITRVFEGIGALQSLTSLALPARMRPDLIDALFCSELPSLESLEIFLHPLCVPSSAHDDESWSLLKNGSRPWMLPPSFVLIRIKGGPPVVLGLRDFYTQDGTQEEYRSPALVCASSVSVFVRRHGITVAATTVELHSARFVRGPTESDEIEVLKMLVKDVLEKVS
ncbi:hypothetical protein EXIGLDRAFT_693942 [Exidia glandulosa HHB12029]|uniref:Uncharacterized protein n=1 Tax=Exidia glandulosa HHB12029 TaxID=1314781 RepID=A0A165GZ38_EXIGL|nr:hypothetical protein EXIGLDRAFT_693942 [Exidia glandulosa HHB12029]